MSGDLFGRKAKPRRPIYEAALERLDRTTLSERAARARWISRNIPKGGMLLPDESLFVFTEARSAFVDGYFIATVVLASAFAEHWMSGILIGRGFGKQCKAGMQACIACARENGIWPDVVLTRLAHLQAIRNPFIHLKDFDHGHGLTQRSWRVGRKPQDVLEEDAKEALETIFALVQLAAFPGFPMRR